MNEGAPMMRPGRLALRLRLLTWRWGPARSAAWLLCVAGLGAWSCALLVLGPDEQASRQALAQARQRADAVPLPSPAETAAAAARALQSGDSARLAAFYQTLGERPLASKYVQTLFDLAAAADVALDQGDYKWLPGADVQRYQIQLPVKGAYAAVRGYSEQVLLHLPFVALDELGVKRETVGDEAIDATLVFTLYLKPGPSVPVGGVAAEAGRQR